MNTYYLGATPVSVYDGNYVCRTYASATRITASTRTTCLLLAGATFHVGGHFYVSSLDPMTGAAWVVLQLFFKDAGGNNLATFATPQIGTNFTTDAWTFLQISNATGGLDLVAPAGTASATCQVYEYAQLGGGGSVYFDDLYVTRASLPPPTAVTITPWASGGIDAPGLPDHLGRNLRGALCEQPHQPHHLAHELDRRRHWQRDDSLRSHRCNPAVLSPSGASLSGRL